MRIRVVGAAGVLSLSMLAGCGGGGSVEDFCDQIEESRQALEGFGDIDPAVMDPDEADEALDSLLDELGKLKDASPEEIRDEMDLLVDFAGDFADATRDYLDKTGGGPVEENMEEFMELIDTAYADYDEDELEEASERLSEYAEEECGLDADFLQ